MQSRCVTNKVQSAGNEVFHSPFSFWTSTVDINCVHEYNLRYEWDERKRLSNLEKHGLDFLDAVAVFEGSHIRVPSVYGGDEDRVLAIGTFEGRCVTVVFTHRSEATRIISFRRARHEERQTYQKLHGGGT